MKDKVLEIIERVANEFLSMSDEEHRAMRTNPKYDGDSPVTLDEDDPMWDDIIERIGFYDYEQEQTQDC